MIYECDRLRSNLWRSIAVNVLVTTVMTGGHYCDDQMQIYELFNKPLDFVGNYTNYLFC